MKTMHICMQCPPEALSITIADFFEEGVAIVKCPRGHESALVVQGTKAELLLSSAAIALLEDFTFEAVASAATALERYYEFALKVHFRATGRGEHFADFFKPMAPQSERQLGAFMLLHALEFGAMYQPDQEMTKFRNAVIHRGRIPNRDEARKFCEYVYATIFHIHEKLVGKYRQTIPLVISLDVGERQRMHVPSGMRVGTVSQRQLFDISRTSNCPRFDDAIAEFEAARKMMLESTFGRGS